MTGMYNVLEALRAGRPLTAKEKAIHEQGLVSVLRELHDRLDAAVADAYGWPADLADEAVLERLVALNAERAAEEARGLIRWLRPEFQDPAGAAKTQKTLVAEPDPADEPAKPAKGKAAKAAKRDWPKTLAARFQAVRGALVEGPPADPAGLAKRFKNAPAKTVAELLDTLAALGQARRLDDGRYAA